MFNYNLYGVKLIASQLNPEKEKSLTLKFFFRVYVRRSYFIHK